MSWHIESFYELRKIHIREPAVPHYDPNNMKTKDGNIRAEALRRVYFEVLSSSTVRNAIQERSHIVDSYLGRQRLLVWHHLSDVLPSRWRDRRLEDGDFDPKHLPSCIPRASMIDSYKMRRFAVVDTRSRSWMLSMTRKCELCAQESASSARRNFQASRSVKNDPVALCLW